MSPLQLGLLVLGALVILGVLGYNHWTTRRLTPRRGAPLSSNEMVEPALDEPLLDPQPDAAAAVLAPDDAIDAAPLGPLADRMPVSMRLGVIDATIDAVCPLALEGEVSGEAVLAALPPTRRVGSKPFAVEGQTAPGEPWEFPRPGQRYTALQAGLQLANRTGALNEIEFSDFVLQVHRFADAVGATPDLPDMMAEVAQARELDQFASAHDAQLVFVVRARRAAWSPGYLLQHAAQQGLVPGALPGRLVLPAHEAGAAPVLVLQFETQAALAEDPEQSVLRQFQLLLDVPHVPQQEQPFARLRAVAQALASRMDGVVTDDAGQPLSEAALDKIAADLDQLYDSLAQRELPAGSVLARRLFS